MDLTKMTLEAIKALAYDQISELQRIQTNLQVINSEIAKRQEVELAKQVKEEPKKEA